jgi:hypothetical protein
MTDAHTWRRALRPTDAVVWGFAAAKDSSTGLAEFIVAVLGIPLAIWFLLLGRPEVAWLLIAVAFGYGVWMTVVAKRKGSIATYITAPVALVLTALAAVLPMAFLLGGPWPRAACVVSLAFWEGFARVTSHTPRAPGWWAHDRMANALVAAGVLKMVKEGDHERLPTLLYPGGDGKVDKVGRRVQIALPQAATLEKCLAKHDELASELGLPPERLHIERRKGAPAGHITFLVLNPPSDDVKILEVPDTWTAGDPIPVGHDRLGNPIEIQQRDCHSAWAAATRSGKTWSARTEVAFPLMDPDGSPLWIISGKDVAEDWQPARELCVEMDHEGDYAYATIKDLPRVLRVLEHVERVAMYRDTIPREERKHGTLVIDEWYRIKVQAKAYDLDKPKGEKIHDLLVTKVSSLAASLAAYNIHIVGCFQRATDNFIGADLRANMTQKFQGIAVKNSEISLFLDTVPQICPSAKGEFLYTYDDSPLTLLQMPLLTNEAWVETCERAKAWRLDHPLPAQLPGGYQPTAETRDKFFPEVPEVVDDPITLAAWDVLRDRGKATATVVFNTLDAELQSQIGSKEQMGKLLANMEGVRRCWGGDGNRTRMYELIRGLSDDPHGQRWLLARGELEPRSEQPSSLDELGLEDVA